MGSPRDDSDASQDPRGLAAVWNIERRCTSISPVSATCYHRAHACIGSPYCTHDICMYNDMTCPFLSDDKQYRIFVPRTTTPLCSRARTRLAPISVTDERRLALPSMLLDQRLYSTQDPDEVSQRVLCPRIRGLHRAERLASETIFVDTLEGTPHAMHLDTEVLRDREGMGALFFPVTEVGNVLRPGRELDYRTLRTRARPCVGDDDVFLGRCTRRAGIRTLSRDPCRGDGYLSAM
ncbi:hypothetical protein C8Q79DRAFT_420165 [Trametes meyenii]|nr:hypothetical protein C8Q79DRAFT_420165 [Trametes meyenii]